MRGRRTHSSPCHRRGCPPPPNSAQSGNPRADIRTVLRKDNASRQITSTDVAKRATDACPDSAANTTTSVPLRSWRVALTPWERSPPTHTTMMHPNSGIMSGAKLSGDAERHTSSPSNADHKGKQRQVDNMDNVKRHARRRGSNGDRRYCRPSGIVMAHPRDGRGDCTERDGHDGSAAQKSRKCRREDDLA